MEGSVSETNRRKRGRVPSRTGETRSHFVLIIIMDGVPTFIPDLLLEGISESSRTVIVHELFTLGPNSSGLSVQGWRPCGRVRGSSF